MKSYIRQVLATGYRKDNFVKYFKGYGVPRACIINTNILKNRREHRSRKLEKGEGKKKERLSFPKPKNRENIVRCYMR